MSELKPCPSCGSSGATVWKGVNKGKYWYVECRGCSFRHKKLTYPHRQLATSAWNNRGKEADEDIHLK